MSTLHDPLEAAPSAKDAASERTWVWVSITSLALIFAVMVGSLWLASRRSAVLPIGAADHGPLPQEVRAEVLALVAPHLEPVEFFEIVEKGRREFRIKGKPKALLSMDFHRDFRPLVAQRLRPLLTPYGEVLSFDITSLDLPPVRLRTFPDAPR